MAHTAGSTFSEAHLSAKQPPTGPQPRFPASDVHQGRPGHHQGPAPQGKASTSRLSSPPRPIKDMATYRALRRRPRVTTGPLSVTFVPGDSRSGVRLAYSVGKRVGGAVDRNRTRRRLKAASSSLSDELEPGAYLVGATRDLSDLAFADLVGLLRKLMVEH